MSERKSTGEPDSRLAFYADWIDQIYGDLPADKYPGPPTAVVESMRRDAAHTAPPELGAVRDALLASAERLRNINRWNTRSQHYEPIEACIQIADQIVAALSAPVAGAAKVEKIEAAMKWPAGCHSGNSCDRHQQCMYVGCRYEGKDIKADIAAAKADVLARNGRDSGVKNRTDS